MQKSARGRGKTALADLSWRVPGKSSALNALTNRVTASRLFTVGVAFGHVEVCIPELVGDCCCANLAFPLRDTELTKTVVERDKRIIDMLPRCFSNCSEKSGQTLRQRA